MGKSGNTPSLGTYDESPLSHLLTEGLQKISGIEKKYPLQKTEAMEKQHARKMVALVKKVFLLLNEDILPKFSLQKKPGFFGIAKDLLCLRNIENDLLTRKYAFFLELKSALPSILNEASKLTSKSNTNAIIEILDKTKNDLFRKVTHIPGAPLETLLEEFIKGIVSLTNEQNIDDLSKTELKDLANDGLLIPTLQDLLFDSPGEFANIIVAHPMSYELVEVLMALINKAPKDLRDLIPFFNPEALVVDLHTGVTGFMVNTLCGATFELTQGLDSTSSIKDYDYKLITHAGKSTFEDHFNIATYYTEYKKPVPNLFFLNEINQYFINYKDSNHVKSEIARGQLLQRFVTAEAEKIQEAILKHRLKCNQDVSDNESCAQERLHDIDKNLKHYQGLLLDNQKTRNLLIKKTSEYQSIAVSALLKNHLELDQQMDKDRNAGLDTSYDKLPLPESLAGYAGDSVKMIAIKSQLDSFISCQSAIVEDWGLKLEITIRKLVQARKEALVNWRQNILQRHLTSMKNCQSQLLTYQQTLEQYTEAEKELPNADNKSLALSIQSLAERTHNLNELQQLAATLLEQVQESARLSTEEYLLDDGNQLHISLTEQSTDMIKKIQLFLQQLESSHTQQHKKQRNLRNRLEKMESQSLASESLKTADPKKMKQFSDQLEKQIALIGRQENESTGRDGQHEVLTLLNEVGSCLNEDKRTEIPFKKIDSLPSIRSMEKSHQHKGFALLLFLIGKTDQVKEWNDYRSRQDDFFKIKPRQNEFSNKMSELLESIKHTKEKLQKTGIEDRNDSIKKARLALEGKKIAYDTLIELLENINQLRQEIEHFENSGNQTLQDDSLFLQISLLKNRLAQLIKTNDEASFAISQLPDKSDLETSQSTITKLLNSSDKGLSSAISLKIDLSPLEEQISAGVNSAKELKQSFLQLLNPNEAAETQSSLIKKSIGQFHDLCNNIQKQKQETETLTRRINDLHDKPLTMEMHHLSLSQNQLLETLENTGNTLLQTLTALLESFNRAFPAEEGSPAFDTSKLLSIRKQLSALPSDEKLIKLLERAGINLDSQKTGSLMANFTLLRQQVDEQLQRHEQVVAVLLQQIDERATLVDETLCPKLDAYLLARNRSYAFKDMLTSRDKNDRELFISTLKEKLAEFKTSGDSFATLEHIRNHRANFPGTRLQPILNNMTVELIDFERKSADSLLAIPHKEPFELMHQRARELLGKLAQSYPSYTAMITKLYEHIITMRNYAITLAGSNETCAPILANLADRLENDIDHFVIAHPEGIVSMETFDQFRDSFTARLRSEDGRIDQYSSWQSILANILIGLATLGLAIGYRLIESKIRTGKSSFLFFNKTDVQNHISEVEVSVNTLAPVF